MSQLKTTFVLFSTIIFSSFAMSDEVDGYYRFSCFSEISQLEVETAVSIDSDYADTNKINLGKKYQLYPLDENKKSHSCKFASGKEYKVEYTGAGKFNIYYSDRIIMEFFANWINYAHTQLRVDRFYIYDDSITPCAVSDPQISRCKTVDLSQTIKNPQEPLDLAKLFGNENR